MNDLLIERDAGVLRITLNAPDRLNSVTTQILEAISDALADSDGVRVAVLTGTGRAFCSGAVTKPGNDNAGIMEAADRLIHALTESPFPIVAAVNGLAAGIGSSIAIACDVQIAKEDDYFLQAFINIGLMPDGGANELLAASIGRTRALRILMSGERLPNTTAAEWGLITHAVPADQWQSLVDETVATFANGPTLAYAATKQAVNAASLPELSATLKRETTEQLELAMTADYIEGVLAFSEKRPAKFTGR